MTPTDMEDALRNLDRRLETVEQILPTLATKADLGRCATKEDLERFATKEDLARFATKEDLAQFAADVDARFATRDDLSAAIETMKRHTDVRFESLRNDIGKVAEGVASLTVIVQENQVTLNTVVQRLDRHEDVLTALVRKHGI